MRDAWLVSSSALLLREQNIFPNSVQFDFISRKISAKGLRYWSRESRGNHKTTDIHILFTQTNKSVQLSILSHTQSIKTDRISHPLKLFDCHRSKFCFLWLTLNYSHFLSPPDAHFEVSKDKSYHLFSSCNVRFTFHFSSIWGPLQTVYKSLSKIKGVVNPVSRLHQKWCSLFIFSRIRWTRDERLMNGCYKNTDSYCFY